MMKKGVQVLKKKNPIFSSFQTSKEPVPHWSAITVLNLLLHAVFLCINALIF